jgi:repressor LexA
MGPIQALTDRQEAILEFIRVSIRERGYPPTLREIGAQMNIRSTNGVSDHLRALERKGYLRREDMKSRALRPTNLGEKTLRVVRNDEVPVVDIHAHAVSSNTLAIPLIGRVAAGPLTTAMQTAEHQFMMDPSLLRGATSGETFALRVRGDSMIEAGIHDGDIIFVRRQETAQRGEIIVALVGDEATVKRYFPETNGTIRLQPENNRMQPIVVRRTEMSSFRILGTMVGLFRSVASTKAV